jgi:hypothetical protein
VSLLASVALKVIALGASSLVVTDCEEDEKVGASLVDDIITLIV